MEEINLLQTIINGGPALLLGIAVVMLWRTWRSDVKKKDEDIAAAHQSEKEIQEKRIMDAESWSKRYNDLATKVQDSLSTSERFMGMVERTIVRGD